MRVLLALLALALATAPAAQAAPILDEADATDLAEQLEAARTATGVCFGWSVEVIANDGSPGGTEAGGSPPGACERELVLTGTVVYTSELSESEDSAALRVDARGFPAAGYPAPTALTGRRADDLLGDEDDKALFELVAALPLLAADVDPALAGRLPEVETGGAPADARVGDGGSSDWMRQHGPTALLALGLGGAAAWLIVTGRRTARPRRT